MAAHRGRRNVDDPDKIGALVIQAEEPHSGCLGERVICEHFAEPCRIALRILTPARGKYQPVGSGDGELVQGILFRERAEARGDVRYTLGDTGISGPREHARLLYRVRDGFLRYRENRLYSGPVIQVLCFLHSGNVPVRGRCRRSAFPLDKNRNSGCSQDDDRNDQVYLHGIGK